ncbi:MAG: NAD(P)/FAD-dependent oxidoreductase, partial [candidate division WOR-3 bacterium]
LENVIKEIYGEKKVEGIIIQNVKTEEERKIPVSAVFIFIGFIPNSEILRGIAKIDEDGGVITNEKMETDTPGIYAVGDVRSKSLRQIVTGASDGAIAAMAAYEYIEENFK